MKGKSENEIVIIGSGSIGQAIARRISAGKHVSLTDLKRKMRMPLQKR